MASPQSPVTRSLYAAVEVVCGKQCCEDVWALTGRRTLMADAPMLPLKTCSMQGTCACKFRKFPDRRQESSERRAVSGYRSSVRSAWYPGEERRGRRGRRATDV
jgi:hypothetical protein